MSTPSLMHEVSRRLWSALSTFHEKQEILLIHGQDDPRLDDDFWSLYNATPPPCATVNWSDDV